MEYWTPEYQKDMGILEWALQSATNMMKRMEHLPYAERLRELGLFILKERIGYTYSCVQIPDGRGMKKEGPDSLVVSCDRTRGTNRST